MPTPKPYVEEVMKLFREKFNWTSFTWNGDNKTGEACAKSTKRKVERFFTTHILEAEKRGEVRGAERERGRVIEQLDELAFESDNGAEIELFINWDEAKAFLQTKSNGE